MKTAMQKVESEIAELWSSPSDQPTYSQIFEILERNLPLEKQQIIDAGYQCELLQMDACQFYNETFTEL
jgi:hypothetical protein